jgi:hypothetical protein
MKKQNSKTAKEVTWRVRASRAEDDTMNEAIDRLGWDPDDGDRSKFIRKAVAVLSARILKSRRRGLLRHISDSP